MAACAVLVAGCAAGDESTATDAAADLAPDVAAIRRDATATVVDASATSSDAAAHGHDAVAGKLDAALPADAGSAAPAAAPPAPLVIEGYGKNATGGLGGRVIAVDSVASFKAALSATGARIVTFSKGGPYDVGGRIQIKNGNLTIDGSTAPEPVTLVDVEVALAAKNIIVRHIRLRATEPNKDGIDLFGGAEDIVIDHCSISWAGDDSLGTDKSGTIRNVTVQWSLIAAPYNCQLAADKFCGRNLASLRAEANIERITYAHNVFISGYKGVLPDADGVVEYANNVWQTFVEKPTSRTRLDLLGNVFEPQGGGALSIAGVYAKGNVGHGDVGAARFGDNVFQMVAARDLKAHLAPQVGATLPCRDRVDQRFVADMLAGTGSLAEAIPAQWDATCAP
jgi:hypothetical protein